MGNYSPWAPHARKNRGEVALRRHLTALSNMRDHRRTERTSTRPFCLPRLSVGKGGGSNDKIAAYRRRRERNVGSSGICRRRR